MLYLCEIGKINALYSGPPHAYALVSKLNDGFRLNLVLYIYINISQENSILKDIHSISAPTL
jgi:hypothetical protein